MSELDGSFAECIDTSGDIVVDEPSVLEVVPSALGSPPGGEAPTR